MTTSQSATRLPASSKVLCGSYGVISIAALITAVDTVLLGALTALAAGMTIWVDIG